MNSPLSEWELGYSGAFFDAEGSIHIGASKLQVQMGNSYLPILEWFRARWGGTLYERGPDAKQPNARQFWDLYWSSQQSQLELLEALLPHLMVLHKEAAIAIDWLSVPSRRAELREEWKTVRTPVPRRIARADNQH